MRAEVGTTVGVREWSEGGHFCTIVCTQGHKKRTIDRVRLVEDGRGHLYTAAYRLSDIGDETDYRADPGTTAEDNPINYDTKWRLRCPCGLDVVLAQTSLNKLARWQADTQTHRLELARLAVLVA